MKHIRKLALLTTAILFIAICTSAAPQNAIKPYTIMIYMNGSDLESDFGAATTDLIEMLESGLDSTRANVIILTGGTKRWQNAVIPENDCIIWEMEDGWLHEVASMGLVSMGNPATLRDFITFGIENYPAHKFGLILWDHGGGSIAGFGHDEQFADDSLTLADMRLAFEEAGLRQNKLEFLGFDACLMATIEMAVIAADYAHVLIASEDLEPGDGWDYVFLSALNQNPLMDGFALGEVIVDTFMDFFGPESDEILNLSVINLAEVQPVMKEMGQLMALASSSIKTQDGPGFKDLAIRRGVTKTFGEGSPRDNYSDMVDIGNMALMLIDLFPYDAAALLRALDRCVVYHRHNSDVNVFGLSTFYIYGGKTEGVESLRAYSDLDMDSDYTQYLHHFFNGLLSKGQWQDTHMRSELVLWQPIGQNRYRMAGLLQTDTPDESLLWPSINGHPATLYPISQTVRTRFYAVPVQINGRDGDIIIAFNRSNPQGQIRGIRYRDGHVIQKGHDPIEPGDKIALYALEWDFDKSTKENTWHLGEVFTVTNSLRLTWDTASSGHRLGYRFTNIINEVEYTPPF